MAKKAYIGVGGVARKAKKIYVGVGSTARKVKKAYIGVGAWRGRAGQAENWRIMGQRQR